MKIRWYDIVIIVDGDTGELLPRNYNVNKEYRTINTEIKYITKYEENEKNYKIANNMGIREHLRIVKFKGQYNLFD